MQLKQYVGDFAYATAFRVYTPEQTLGVDALDKPGVGNDKTYLVGLEVSDEVPFYVGGEDGGFFTSSVARLSPNTRCPAPYASMIASAG